MATYTIDEPETFYESSPILTRQQQQSASDSESRVASTFDVRQSGVGALGMGFLSMGGDDDGDDDDDDDDDDKNPFNSPTLQKQLASNTTSKHAALAAATAAANSNKTPSPSTQVIAAPQPGYPAPIAALNLARPEPAAQPRLPPALQISVPNPFEPANPFKSPISSHSPPRHQPPSPTPSMLSSEPHPLHPPITPITPVFVRPAKSPGVTFAPTSEHKTPIIRGNSEETLLPARGQKGDDFWRRFSMVAKEENQKPSSQKESPWLKKTRTGSTRLSLWVWVVGIFLLACIGGAIGLGWHFTHNAPGHQAPKSLGGQANESAVPVSMSASSDGVGRSISPGGSTVLHVSPTHTVAKRVFQARATGVVGAGNKHKRRMH